MICNIIAHIQLQYKCFILQYYRVFGELVELPEIASSRGAHCYARCRVIFFVTGNVFTGDACNKYASSGSFLSEHKNRVRSALRIMKR